MMSNISSLLAKVNLSNLQSKITQTLKIINDFVGVDRTYIFKYDFEHKTCSNTFEYCREGISQQIHNLQNIPLEDLSDWVTKHFSNEEWYIKDSSKLKDDFMRNHLDFQGIKSLLVIPLHDIGKIDIPDSVLLKPGRLTPEEFETIKKHIKTGDDILSNMVKFYPKTNLVLMGRIIAKYHHEKWNGMGYLSGLKGEEIPLPTRIMALVDVYDALRSKRPYKEPMSHQMAYDIIDNDSGKHFDPDVVEAFIKIHQQFDAIFNSLSRS